MKKHAIIPIFIPHQGCPNGCVFCNQKTITARKPDIGKDEITTTIETWLSTLVDRPGLETVEIAFFGGSFTGIPMKQQSAYLEIAKRYKSSGLVQKIHLSTRPDYINREILNNLKAFGVDIIELGVQSFDEEVLTASGRGHDSSCIYTASALIHEYDFELGIQLMLGLPTDSPEKCLYSARETVKIKPSLARLYPTVVIQDTALMELYKKGLYTPLTTEEAVSTAKEMYKILTEAGIQIIRVGLKSSDLIREDGEISGHTFHPAFRQLVEGSIAREKMEYLLKRVLSSGNGKVDTKGAPDVCDQNGAACLDANCEEVTFLSSEKWFSNMIGHKGCNKAHFAKTFPHLSIDYKTSQLQDGSIAIAVADGSYFVVK
ncbi:MAG: radical SAM protein [Firmicutes bacterium]|nr:radical SAM protein [Bacillota bacterium]